MKPQNEIGKFVRGMRSLLGINQTSLAADLNITRSSLVKIENGNRKWAHQKDIVGNALTLFSKQGVDLYESEEYFVILVKK
jgi:DNA-binding XRE family transcriptional regulator